VLAGNQAIWEFLLSSRSPISGGRPIPIDERGETLREESETNDGVSVDNIDCPDGDGKGVG